MLEMGFIVNEAISFLRVKSIKFCTYKFKIFIGSDHCINFINERKPYS